MSNIDQTIQALFEKLNQRKARLAELKQIQSRKWKTNCTFRLMGSPSTTNLQTANIDTVQEIAVQICMYEQAIQRASGRLKQQIDLKVQQYHVSDWFEDIEKRLTIIDLRSEEEAINQLEARLNQVLSPEERRRIEVELLAKELE